MKNSRMVNNSIICILKLDHFKEVVYKNEVFGKCLTLISSDYVNLTCPFF